MHQILIRSELGLLRPPIYFDRLTVIKKTGWSVNRRRLRCARCYCTTCFLVCRSSFTHCSRPKCSNCSCPSHPLISVTAAVKWNLTPVKNPHPGYMQSGGAAGWSRDVETTDRPSTDTRVLTVGLLSAECNGRCFFALACRIMKWKMQQR